jgi:hypothetical protein
VLEGHGDAGTRTPEAVADKVSERAQHFFLTARLNKFL